MGNSLPKGQDSVRGFNPMSAKIRHRGNPMRPRSPITVDAMGLARLLDSQQPDNNE